MTGAKAGKGVRAYRAKAGSHERGGFEVAPPGQVLQNGRARAWMLTCLKQEANQSWSNLHEEKLYSAAFAGINAVYGVAKLPSRPSASFWLRTNKRVS